MDVSWSGVRGRDRIMRSALERIIEWGYTVMYGVGLAGGRSEGCSGVEGWFVCLCACLPMIPDRFESSGQTDRYTD